MKLWLNNEQDDSGGSFWKMLSALILTVHFELRVLSIDRIPE